MGPPTAGRTFPPRAVSGASSLPSHKRGAGRFPIPFLAIPLLATPLPVFQPARQQRRGNRLQPDPARHRLSSARIGDRFHVQYLRDGKAQSANVTVGSYEIVSVSLEDVPGMSARQRAMRSLWLRGR